MGRWGTSCGDDGGWGTRTSIMDEPLRQYKQNTPREPNGFYRLAKSRLVRFGGTTIAQLNNLAFGSLQYACCAPREDPRRNEVAGAASD